MGIQMISPDFFFHALCKTGEAAVTPEPKSGL